MNLLQGKSDRYIAALAVREKSITLIEKGIDSLFKSNAIDDYRDIISGLVLYYDAINRIGFGADKYFKTYSHNHPEYSNSIEEFLLRSPEEKSISVGGYKTVFNPDFNYEYNFL